MTSRPVSRGSGLLHPLRLLAGAHDWRTAAGTLGIATLLQLFLGTDDLALPLATNGTKVAILAGLLAGQASAAALWSVTPWRHWMAARRGEPVVLVLGAGFGGLTLVVAALVEGMTAAPVLAGWTGAVGLAWLGLALTRDLTTAWLVPVLLTMGSLVVPDPGVPPELAGLFVANWYSPGLDGSVVVVPAVLLLAGLALCSLRLPHRS